MDPRMMNAWLQSQSQKQQPSTRSMELKRQGMAITEQLNAQEEKYAKSHKSMLTSMIKQYGSDKGTRVFYAKVREDVKKLNENCASIDSSPVADALRKIAMAQELKQKSTIKLNNKKEDKDTETK
jgi:hypothetical protein